jgi:hypothetical protein
VKRPTEIIGGAIILVGALVEWGILDQPTAAWITAGLTPVPGIITAIVEWFRKRPA